MQYLLLAFVDQPESENISASVRTAFEHACQISDEALRENGYLLAAARLQNGSPAAILRVQDGELSISDLAAAGTYEPLTALFIIQARDLNEAIRVAARMPQAQRGSIHLLTIQSFERPLQP